MSKLKGMSYKELLIDHAEKFVLGIVVLMALSCVFGARWAGIDKSPDELVEQVTAARQEVLSPDNTLPEDGRQSLVSATDIRERANRMLSALEGSRFHYNNVMHWPLYPKQEPIKEPEWLTVEDPVVDAGRVILATRPEGTAPDGVVPGSESVGPETSGQIARQDQSPTTKPDPLGLDLGTRRGAGGGRAALGGGAADTTLPGGADAFPADPALAAPDEAAAGGTAMAGYQSARNGRGARYAVFRALFPLQRQIEKVAEALNEEVYTNVANLVDIVDFELQRQTAVAGANPWSGPWEEVSLEVAQDILDQVEAFEPDVVDSAIISDVMTMPIPSRVVGVWGIRASHPRLENFQLSKEQMQQEMMINQKILEAFERQQATLPQPLKRGGFASQQHDIRGMSRSVLTGSAEAQSQIMENINQTMDTEQLKQRLAARIEQRANPVGRLLLFRYFDFDVEPGNAYRYRVRLTLRNPNYGRPPEELLQPGIAEGRTRVTEWSQPTEPVIIDEDVEYYLSEVETPRSRPEEPTAAVDLFQWDPEIGTTVNKELELEFGQLIGGKTEETPVLKPIQETFDEEEYEFKTSEYLVDVADGPILKEELHPDLTFTKQMKQRFGVDIGVADQALVVNKYGEIVTVDAHSEQAGHRQASRRVEAWAEHFAHLKQKEMPVAEAGDLDALAVEMFEADPGAMPVDPAAMPAGPRARNPLRKSRGFGRRRGRPSAEAYNNEFAP